MSFLRDRSVVLGEFSDHWRHVGGPTCAVTDLMQPDICGRMLVVCRRDGDWMYHYTGEMHDQINGVHLRGYVRNQLPPHIWVRTKALFDHCVETGTSQMVESTGHVGRSVDLLIKTLRVLCTPPEGYDAALAIAWDWEFSLDGTQEEILADLVGRCAGPALRQQFLADRPGVARVSAQLALLRELVEGAYGNLSPADRTYLQIFLLGLHSEYETDGESLYRIH